MHSQKYERLTFNFVNQSYEDNYEHRYVLVTHNVHNNDNSNYIQKGMLNNIIFTILVTL